MTSGKSKTDGCWTCRIRRKRCNAIRPVCESCRSLEITCHYSEEKPLYMDGKDEQQKKAQSIKLHIKQSAMRRRARQNLKAHDQEMIISLDDQETLPLQNNNSDVLEYFSEQIDLTPGPTITVGSARSTDSVAGCLNEGGNSSPATNQASSSESLQHSSGNSDLSLGKAGELGFIMIYLDHVFPFLFPFYRPTLLQTGRHWLLSLLLQDDTSFYTAASLSAYFYAVAVQTTKSRIPGACKDLVWGQLTQNMDKALKAIQKDILTIDFYPNQASLMKRFHMMSKIVQLLIVESTVRRNVDWLVHIAPAVELFHDIFKVHGSPFSEPNLEHLLQSLAPLRALHNKPVPNTADQSAFLFFIAFLLYVDIISSTALNKPPRLQNYHTSLLRTNTDASSSFMLETYIGCQDWVLLAISDTCQVATHLKTLRMAGRSAEEPTIRAEMISQVLNEGLSKLELIDSIERRKTAQSTTFVGYYTLINGNDIDAVSTRAMTKIWAYSAKLYLSVVMSGWNNNNSMSDIVEHVLGLLQNVNSPAQLRSLSWPICVTGCLAQQHQQEKFHAIVQKLAEFRVFGTVNEAYSIMEEVWKARDLLGAEWDIAACLNILGSPALLI